MITPNEIEFIPLSRLPPYVLLSSNHRLAKHPSLTLSDLADESMILLDLPYSRDFMLRMFEEDGIEPQVAITTPNIEMVRSLVGNGYGFAILHVQPRCDVSLDGQPLIRIPLEGRYRKPVIGLALLQHTKRTRLLQEFQNHCMVEISDDHIPGMSLREKFAVAV